MELGMSPQQQTKKDRKLGRTPYLESLIKDLVRGGEAIGLPDEALRALVINALSGDARIGGKYGRTLAEAVDMCQEALTSAGIPTDREEVIRLLANPKMTDAAAKALSQHLKPTKRR